MTAIHYERSASKGRGSRSQHDSKVLTDFRLGEIRCMLHTFKVIRSNRLETEISDLYREKNLKTSSDS